MASLASTISPGGILTDGDFFTVPDLSAYQTANLWIIITGFVIAFFLSFGIGANDVANTFGTSVGAKVISLKNACIIATIFEMLGASLVGYKVSDTIRKGIIDVSQYQDDPTEYMIGNLAALGGSATWLILATFLKMPISGTHSIVGAVLGFSLVARGFNGIQWLTLGKIVGSWFVSPLLSGLVSGSIFILIRRFILSRTNPIEPGLRSLPIFYGLTLFINVISILLDGPEMLKIQIQGLPAWSEQAFGFLIASGIGLIVAWGVHLVMVPRLRKKLKAELGADYASSCTSSTNNKDLVFVIGNTPGGTESPGSSHDATPMNVSLDDMHKINGISSINGDLKKCENGKNGQLPSLQITDCSSGLPATDVDINVNLSKNNGYYGIVNEKNIRNYMSPEEKKKMLEVIPMDGISPNSSAVPLIKGGSASSDDGSGREDIECRQRQEYLDEIEQKDLGDKPGVGRLFSFLQILTAAFGSFAHGGNDVSNAIGPLIALYLVYDQGSVQQKAATPIFLLVYGGIGISLGLWIWGRRVIKTMGEDLTKITPSSGFTIEIGAAITVLVASKIGLPISTTHCKVGSVVSVGQIRSKGSVDLKLFRNIIFAWLVTLPVSGGLTALIMFVLKSLIIGDKATGPSTSEATPFFPLGSNVTDFGITS